ncbi:hypothetical protein MMC30_008793 [Trapelia coarctata]|nr:hypothetical protein [Trapelia coarctata]
MCIGVLMISTVIFAMVLLLFTKAKRHEILAAAAAYTAVLVVFVGNVGNNGYSATPTIFNNSGTDTALGLKAS